jgi:hypothetical protein
MHINSFPTLLDAVRYIQLQSALGECPSQQMAGNAARNVREEGLIERPTLGTQEPPFLCGRYPMIIINTTPIDHARKNRLIETCQSPHLSCYPPFAIKLGRLGSR